MQKTQLFVFDLDDTLYDEMTYVYSGFLAVAKFLEETYQLPAKSTFLELKQILEADGRGLVFDTFLKQKKLFSLKLVKRCVFIYRHHIPEISLYPDAKRVFKRFQKSSLFILTDGHKAAQHLKLQALDLYKQMNHCYLTNRYGIKYNKPSPHCFLLLCQREHVLPKDVVYIADNPYKDFIGIKPLNFQTVRILRGRYKDVKLDLANEADKTITTLDEL